MGVTMIELGYLYRNGDKYYYESLTDEFWAVEWARNGFTSVVVDPVIVKKLRMRLYSLTT